jgi:hypothetical protein
LTPQGRWRLSCALKAVLCAFVLMLRPPAAAAQGNFATITYPPDGAVNVNMLQPIQWTAVASVQAYTLWVGTSVGANNVVNTFETQQTSYQPASLPANVTLYARIWTKVGGVWRYVDSTFSAASLTATLTSPVDGASNISPLLPIQWTSVLNVQAYTLWVGTSVGANNVVNTFETQQTSYQPASLPANVTLYARIWTKVSGVWRYVDSTFSAASLTATLTSPANGASNVSPLQPIQWTTVLNVQAYTLWVGTSVAANNIVNTFETQQTSYQPASLPANVTLYARMWTKVAGVWRYVDSTFSAASLAATLTSPANGAVNVSPTPLFQWTSALNAQAYVLWVGTTPGLKDLIGTDEVQQTSYQSPVTFGLNQTLYARMWTKAGGVWRYTDSTFSTPVVPATITAPADGATNVNPLVPVTWTAVGGAQAYVLWIGTTAGANNVVSTAEMQQTSYQPASLPAGQTLYARVWTKISSSWYHTDSTFTAGSLVATLIFPADGAQNVDDTIPASWTAVTGAQAYVLYVGTTQGAQDLLESSEGLDTAVPFSGMPPNRVLYARLWTKAGGHWRYRDSTFEVSSVAPEFVYPVNGATAVDVSQSFAWTVARNADAYELQIGTSPSAADVLDSGAITTPGFLATGLSQAGPLYGRVWARVNNTWTFHTDIVFTLDGTVPAANIEVPFNGESSFDASQPFQWTASDLASGYRLMIGTTFGAADVHDSGVIRISRRFVPNLPLGVPLFGRLQTRINGQWLTTDFTFSVAHNTISAAVAIKSALWATDLVQTMASDDDNRPYVWSPLFSQIYPAYAAVCTTFSAALMQALADMNLPLSSRVRDIAFDTNGVDAHTLVEVYNPDSASWIILDPTFDLTVQRLDGSLASVEDVSNATRAFGWTSVVYKYLGLRGDQYATDYYLDYPLLYLNVAQPLVHGQGASPIPYLDEVFMPVAAAPQMYAIRCTGASSTQVVIDGVLKTVACDGIDGLSHTFTASSVALPTGSTDVVQLYRLHRFVF